MSFTPPKPKKQKDVTESPKILSYEQLQAAVETLNLQEEQNNLPVGSAVEEVLNQLVITPELVEELTNKIKALPGDDNQYLVKTVIDGIGRELQKENAFVKIKSMSEAQSGKDLMEAMKNLKNYVENFNEKKTTFKKGKFVKSLLKWPVRRLKFVSLTLVSLVSAVALSFFATPLITAIGAFAFTILGQILFQSKLEKNINELKEGENSSSDDLLPSIVESIDRGHEHLKADTDTLLFERHKMLSQTQDLKNHISLLEMIEKNISKEPEEQSVNALYYLRQRILDLQQTLLVNQQGILAMKVVIDNNQKLLQASVQTKSVTVNALRISLTVAQSVTNQDLIANNLKDLNDQTNELIQFTPDQITPEGLETKLPEVEVPAFIPTTVFPEGQVLDKHTFEDGSKIVALVDDQAYLREQDLMKTDVKSYNKRRDSYGNVLPVSQVFSLRNKDGVSKVTFGVIGKEIVLPLEFQGNPLSSKNRKLLKAYAIKNDLFLAPSSAVITALTIGGATVVLMVIAGVIYLISTKTGVTPVAAPVDPAQVAEHINNPNSILTEKTKPLIGFTFGLYATWKWFDYFASFKPDDAFSAIITPAMMTYLAFQYPTVLAWFGL